MAKGVVFLVANSDKGEFYACADAEAGITVGDNVQIPGVSGVLSVVDMDIFHAAEITRYLSRAATVYGNARKVNHDGEQERMC